MKTVEKCCGLITVVVIRDGTNVIFQSSEMAQKKRRRQQRPTYRLRAIKRRKSRIYHTRRSVGRFRETHVLHNGGLIFFFYPRSFPLFNNYCDTRYDDGAKSQILPFP